MSAECEAKYTGRRWPVNRVARAAWLAGAGKSSAEIAADTFVQSTAGSVERALNTVGLRKPEPHLRATVQLPADITGIEKAAKARKQTPAQLLERITATLAAEPALIDNIIDDGVTA